MPEPLLIPIEPFSWSDLNLEQTFRLIDKYIPLKICQAHEIIPLTFKEQFLTLGIVDLQRSSINTIIQKLLTRANLKLKGQQLDSKTYQLIISSYLNYQQTSLKTSAIKASPPRPIEPTIGVSEKATFVVDEIPQLPTNQPTPTANHSISPFSVPMVGGSISSPVNDDDKDTVIFEGDATALQNPPNSTSPLRHQLFEAFAKRSPVMVPNAKVQMQPSPELPPPVYEQLQLHPQHLHLPLENLAHLPASELWQELLGRILSEGIGRLYFENHPNEGRILLSESGVMKEALYGLPLITFHGVLNEFKRLAHLPPIPVDHPKKVEMEQYYDNERILLRLRVMPGKYGEEGTLQVLRGQALNFYQQQQMDELGHEAIEAAQQLERKLRHIYLRSQINPSFLNALSELYGFCDRFRAQLDNISRHSH